MLVRASTTPISSAVAASLSLRISTVKGSNRSATGQLYAVCGRPLCSGAPPTRPHRRAKEVTMAKQLVLLTYTPRELDEEEYAKFIREIDYPAFRQNPHIIDYSCWRVAESVQGEERFTHFDLMAVDDLANWQAIASDPLVAGNVERWTKDWSR